MDLTSTQVRQILLRSYFFNLARLRYSAQYMPIDVHLFSAEENNRVAEPFLGWGECLPASQICVIPIAGKHTSMMRTPHVEVLGQKLSTAIRNASR
jgi:hypothetical protein